MYICTTVSDSKGINYGSLDSWNKKLIAMVLLKEPMSPYAYTFKLNLTILYTTKITLIGYNCQSNQAISLLFRG